jgi:D-glycerate 3-kinase
MSSHKHTDTAVLRAVEDLLTTNLGSCGRNPFVLGICGPQGSGKSTLAADLSARLTKHGIRTATLSIDDIYKTRKDRAQLAETSHPLFRTRGVPGTHDVSLALDIIMNLENRQPARLPRFDKSTDDRVAADAWEQAPADTSVLILEGWCIGARADASEQLSNPINLLEAEEDPHGFWRAKVEASLAGEYQVLNARLDALVLLAAASFDVVYDWRKQQENALRRKSGAGTSDEAIIRFIQHYERLTRRILRDMPSYADLVVQLDWDRRPISIVRLLGSLSP